MIYATAPVMKVVAEAKVGAVLESDPKTLWNMTKEYSGIGQDFFVAYFHDRTRAIAYQLQDVQRYDEPKPLSELGVKAAPQSFVYL